MPRVNQQKTGIYMAHPLLCMLLVNTMAIVDGRLSQHYTTMMTIIVIPCKHFSKVEHKLLFGPKGQVLNSMTVSKHL